MLKFVIFHQFKNMIFFFILFLIFFLSIASAENRNEKYLLNDFDISLDLYQSNRYQNESKSNFYQITPKDLIDKLSHQEFNLQRDFETFVVIQTSNKNMSVRTTTNLLPIEFTISEIDHNDWVKSNNTVTSKSTVITSDSIKINTKLPNYPNYFSLKTYDELWIDYKFSEKYKLCDLAIISSYNGTSWPNKNNLKTKENYFAFDFISENIKTIAHIDNTKSKWKKKDNMYLLSRYLGLRPDSDWRYTQIDKNTFKNHFSLNKNNKFVAQRRMNKLVDQFSILTIEHKGTLTDVNLIVSFDNRLGREELISIPVRNISKMDLSQYDVNIGFYINELINKKGEKPRKIYLKELILHLEVGDNNFQFDKSIKSITIKEKKFVFGQIINNNYFNQDNFDKFIEKDINEKNVNTLFLKSHSKKIDFQKVRHIIDLSSLNRIGDISLSDLKILITNSFENYQCSIEIDSIHLASNVNETIPGYLSELEKLTQKYSDNSIASYKDPKLNKTVRFLAYSSPSVFYNKNFQEKKIIDNSFNNINHNDWVSVNGMKIFSNGTISSINPYYDFSNFKIDEALDLQDKIILDEDIQPSGARIIGNGNNIKIFWPTIFKPHDNDLFYFSVPKGGDKIKSVELVFKSKNGKKWIKKGKVNSPIHLFNSPKNIDSVEIILNFSDYYFDFVLGEIAIISPTIFSYDQFLELKIPFRNYQLMKMDMSSKGIYKVGDFHSYWPKEIDHGLIEFSVSRPISWLDEITIDYQFPDNWLTNDSCILTGDFIYTNQTFTRSFCLNKNSAIANFTMAELGLINYQNLNKIVWHIKKPLGTDGSLSLKTRLNTWGLSTIKNQIKHTPLLYFDNKPYYFGNDDIHSFTSKNVFKLKLPKEFLKDYVFNPYKFRVNDNSWFELERIILKPSVFMNWNQWVSLAKPLETEQKSIVSMELIIFILFLLFLVILLLKGYFFKVENSRFNIIRLFNLKVLLLPGIVKHAISSYKVSKILTKLYFWLGITLILYLIGSISVYKSYFISFGGMAAVVVWIYLVIYLKPLIKRFFPLLSKKLYADSGSKYFLGFSILIALMSFMFLLGLKPLAIQLGVIGYFMLIAGLVTKILNSKRSNSNNIKKIANLND